MTECNLLPSSQRVSCLPKSSTENTKRSSENPVSKFSDDLILIAAVNAESALHHDIHQSARYDDDFLGRFAFHEFHRAFGGEGGGFEVGFGGVGGDGDFAA